MCLNPFFIRARFQSFDAQAIRWEVPGLNPFFIRARFQRVTIHPEYVKLVLIPSSSGQGFKVDLATSVAAKTEVLIPSSSGQGFKVHTAWRSYESTYCLNPFFIRARFQRAVLKAARLDSVLIPSSSGQGFKVILIAFASLAIRCLNPFFIRARFQRTITSKGRQLAMKS